MKLFAQVSVDVCSLLLGENLEVELLGHMVTPTFSGTHVVLHGGCSVTSPQQCLRVHPLHILNLRLSLSVTCMVAIGTSFSKISIQILCPFATVLFLSLM